MTAPPSTRSPLRSVLLVAVLGAVLAACGGDDGARGDAPSPPDATSPAVTTPPAAPVGAGTDVDVLIEFPRYLQVQRRLEMAFDNHSESDLVVTRWAVRSPMFQPVEAETGHSTIRAGQRRDLKVDVGPAVCPAPDGPSAVDVALQLGATSYEGTIEIDPEPLARIHRSECGQERVHETVDLSFAQDFTVDGDTLSTSLDVALVVDDEPVVVSDVRGSVIIDVQPADPDVNAVTVDKASPTGSIPVQMRIVRCDPHAVTESKKTFQFATWASIGAGGQTYTAIQATGALRDELQRLIDECVLEEFAQGSG